MSKKHNKYRKFLAPILIISVIILLSGLICTYHIVWVYNIPTLVQRKNLGFKEPVSSIEDIKAIGWEVAPHG